MIRPISRFNRASLLDGQLYITMPETGLNVLEGDTFRPLPGTARLASEVYPVVFRYDERRLLIGRRFGGFFLYDGAALTPFPTELDEYLKSASLYRGIALPDGTIALSTTNAGMALMDRAGPALMTLDRGQGLPLRRVYNLMTDREGAIWPWANAACREEAQSPFSPRPCSEADGVWRRVDTRASPGASLHRVAERGQLPGACGLAGGPRGSCR